MKRAMLKEAISRRGQKKAKQPKVLWNTIPFFIVCTVWKEKTDSLYKTLTLSIFILLGCMKDVNY